MKKRSKCIIRGSTSSILAFWSAERNKPQLRGAVSLEIWSGLKLCLPGVWLPSSLCAEHSCVWRAGEAERPQLKTCNKHADCSFLCRNLCESCYCAMLRGWETGLWDKCVRHVLLFMHSTSLFLSVFPALCSHIWLFIVFKTGYALWI